MNDQYRLYVLRKIERGLKDVEQGRVISQEKVEKLMAKWLNEQPEQSKSSP